MFLRAKINQKIRDWLYIYEQIRKRGGRKSRAARKQVQPGKVDPAIPTRAAAPVFGYRSDEDKLLAGIRATRGTPRPGGDHRAPDSHIPVGCRLGSYEWEKAASLPSLESLMAEEQAVADSNYDWIEFLGRVLPQHGQGPPIQEDQCQSGLPLGAPLAEVEAQLSRWGWQAFPTVKKLRKHMLDRVERDYADHLLEHGYTPGEWCILCECRCAESVDAFIAAAARADGYPYGETTSEDDEKGDDDADYDWSDARMSDSQHAA